MRAASILTNSFKLTALLLLAGATAPLRAQTEVPAVPEAAPVDVDDEADGQEIVVTGQRLRGRVLGDIEPEITLDRREVRALGASRPVQGSQNSSAVTVRSTAVKVTRRRADGRGGAVVVLDIGSPRRLYEPAGSYRR